MPKYGPFKDLRTSPEIVRLALILDVRPWVPLRNPKDLLHERGFDVIHGAVRFWWHSFRPMFASGIRG